ncbi:MAG TPA: hypothetical protein VHN36_10210 [Ilumatobacteraceae bacterium]|jgi:hypothetical protein|nr:hypothetical protein [Ilumatobacteraceae bacterium]
MTHSGFRDFGDLVITTDAASAAYAYSRGIQLLITSSVDAEALLRDAVTADPNFALAWVALALAFGARGLAAEHHECADRADTTLAGATRRERQHIEVIRLTLSGHRDRAAVLGREHLSEFPNDVLVSYVLASRGLA